MCAQKYLRPVLLVILILGAGSAFAQSAGRVPEAQFTDTGSEGCLRCHAGDSMTVIAETAHGRPDDPHAPFAQEGCESCHGPGSLHVSRARGGAGFPPLARFGEDGDPVPEQLGHCLGCHGEEMGDHAAMAWTGSMHDNGMMTCSTCHQMHTTENILADRSDQIANCATCHEEQIAGHNRFENRGIVFERLTCHDCHDVHQLLPRE